MMKYIIEVPLSEVDGTWRILCTCITAEGAGEVVTALLRHAEAPPVIRIVSIRA